MFASTMMPFPLTLAHVLTRAGELFGASEVVSRMPDKSLHRYTYRDLHRRAMRSAVRCSGSAWKKATASRRSCGITTRTSRPISRFPARARRSTRSTCAFIPTISRISRITPAIVT